jgi:hypothetical protein
MFLLWSDDVVRAGAGSDLDQLLHSEEAKDFRGRGMTGVTGRA